MEFWDAVGLVWLLVGFTYGGYRAGVAMERERRTKRTHEAN